MVLIHFRHFLYLPYQVIYCLYIQAILNIQPIPLAKAGEIDLGLRDACENPEIALRQKSVVGWGWQISERST